MEHALFLIKPSCSQKQALKELKTLGLEHPYFIQELGQRQIGGFFKTLPTSIPKYSENLQAHSSINWDEQWSLHSPYYNNGLLKVNLNDFGATLETPFLLLEPGPGFGDLSHPTTHLMLETLIPYVQGKRVLDIGSGSGILSLAAAKLGASHVIGLDIDESALDHAKKNASLNNLANLNFCKSLNTNDLEFDLILINMISQEQKEVFRAYPSLNPKEGFIISGILNNQKVNYLKEFPYSSYHIQNIKEKDDWASFVISR